MLDDHLTFQENLAAYALGALDLDEASALRAHVSTCARCQAELADLERISTGLLSALPLQVPRPALKRNLAARLPGAETSIFRRARNGWTLERTAAAVALFLLLGINLITYRQVRNLQSQQLEMARRLQAEQAALALITSADARTLRLSSGTISGSLIISNAQNSGVLIVSNLPQLQVNENYQAWLIDPQGGRMSAAVFLVDPDEMYTLVSMTPVDSIMHYTGLGVTIEPAGGSPHPTGPKILGIEF